MIGPGSDKNTIRDGGSTALYTAVLGDRGPNRRGPDRHFAITGWQSGPRGPNRRGPDCRSGGRVAIWAPVKKNVLGPSILHTWHSKAGILTRVSCTLITRGRRSGPWCPDRRHDSDRPQLGPRRSGPRAPIAAMVLTGGNWGPGDLGPGAPIA